MSKVSAMATSMEGKNMKDKHQVEMEFVNELVSGINGFLITKIIDQHKTISKLEATLKTATDFLHEQETARTVNDIRKIINLPFEFLFCLSLDELDQIKRIVKAQQAIEKLNTVQVVVEGKENDR